MLSLLNFDISLCVGKRHPKQDIEGPPPNFPGGPSKVARENNTY